MRLQKCRTGVERRRQRRWTQNAAAASRLDHGDVIEPANFVERANAAVQGDEVCTAAEEQVLAVVDDFASAGVFVGRGASTDVGAALNEMHFVAGIGEC